MQATENHFECSRSDHIAVVVVVVAIALLRVSLYLIAVVLLCVPFLLYTGDFLYRICLYGV